MDSGRKSYSMLKQIKAFMWPFVGRIFFLLSLSKHPSVLNCGAKGLKTKFTHWKSGAKNMLNIKFRNVRKYEIILFAEIQSGFHHIPNISKKNSLLFLTLMYLTCDFQIHSRIRCSRSGPTKPEIKCNKKPTMERNSDTKKLLSTRKNVERGKRKITVKQTRAT